MSSQGAHAGRKFGSYTLRQRLGRGGMGEVYLAHDANLDRMVAVKTLVERFAGNEAILRRFQREARAAARLNHPNIVQVHGVDLENDPPYLVMELVEGSSLDAFIIPGQPMPWQQALNITAQVAAALQGAHTAGIIHRDIKPQNILIDKQQRVKVSDFGIAKLIGATTSLTTANVTLGSPCYMSPEQCGIGEVVPASDLFSLGITTFEMLTGHLPFEGEKPLIIVHKIATEPLPPLSKFISGIPPVVQAFVDALTARDLTQRYQSAAEVLEDLKELRAGTVPERLKGRQLQVALAAPPQQDSVVSSQSSLSLVDDLLGEKRQSAAAKGQPAGRSIPWVPLAVAGGVMVLIALLVPWFNGRGRVPRMPPQRETREQSPAPAIEPPAYAGTTPGTDPAQGPPPGMPPPPPPGAPLPGTPGFMPPPPGQGPVPGSPGFMPPPPPGPGGPRGQFQEGIPPRAMQRLRNNSGAR